MAATPKALMRTMNELKQKILTLQGSDGVVACEEGKKLLKELQILWAKKTPSGDKGPRRIGLKKRSEYTLFS